MRLLVTTILAATFLLPFSAFGESKTVTHTVQQPFGGSQSPDDARTAGIARAKREALERFGTYIESKTIVKDSQLDSDEILALTAGVTKAEVIKQKNYTDGDGFGLEITVKVELDTSVLEKSLKRLLANRNYLKDLKDSREREKKLLAQIAELQKENKKKGRTKQQSAKLKKEFNAASQGLAALEWFTKAYPLLDGGKYTDLEKVIEYLTKAILLDPNYAHAYINRGAAYNSLKQVDLAIADYEQAIRIDPNNAVAYNNRGTAYLDLKQYDLAIADYGQAIRLNPLDPNYAVVYINRGAVYVKLNQLDRAIADLDQAIRLNPNYAVAYEGRGTAYLDLKQYDLAIADYSQAIRLNPLSPNCAAVYYNRGNAYAKLNQLDRAIADYDQVIHIDPNNAEAYEARGINYLRSKQAQNGCADLEKACKLGNCTWYEHARKIYICR